MSIVVLVAIALFTGYLKLSNKPQISEVDEDVELSPKKNLKRTPASVLNRTVMPNKFKGVPEIDGSSFRERDPDSEPTIPFSNTTPIDEAVGGGNVENFAENNYGINANSRSEGSRNYRSSLATNGSSTSGGKGSVSENVAGVTTFTNQGFPSTIPAPGTSGSNSNTDTSSSSPTPISCSANYGGGAYSHPIGVSLSCSSTAEISYCLNQGACCDPETDGTDYSTAVVVGAKEGNYCLSFYGEGSDKTSNVVQVSYTIDNTYPHLQVTHPKLVYQTTQLAGQSILASNDFSKAGYFMGQVNLKSHNPGTDGLGLDCEQIVDQYAALINPMTSIILSLYDMLGAIPSLELEVPLNLSRMDYGDNHITTYVVNQNYSAYLYSCSTTKVTLADFDLFQMESAHWSVGDTGVQEFSGGFQSVGLYEDGSDFFRAPASVANEADLKTGLFDVVF